MVKIAINGANGRMGQAICDVVNGMLSSTVVALIDINTYQINNLTVANHNGMFKEIDADVIIDFSSPEGLKNVLDNATCKVVSGTTGINDELFAQMREYGEKYGLIWGSNTSLGVNLMFAMVKKLGSILGSEYDAEVYERHHRMKKDAPSGTAVTIGKKIAEGRGVAFQQRDYSIQGERVNEEIGFAVERGGKTVGYHEARFIADEETIWFGHEAHDRSLFAKGAVKLANLIVEKDIKGYNEVCDVISSLL